MRREETVTYLNVDFRPIVADSPRVTAPVGATVPTRKLNAHDVS